MSSATRSRRWRGSRGAGPARRPADAGNLVATGTCAGLLQVLPGHRANRALVGTIVATVAEVGPGVLGGDAVERGAERPL